MNLNKRTTFLAILVLWQGNLPGQTFSTLHSFTGSTNDGDGPSGDLILSGATLYGATDSGGGSGNGTVFRANTDGMGFAILHSFTGYGTYGTNGDGAGPLGGLVLSGSTLYGTTRFGGSSGNGTVFDINTNGTGFTNLHSFIIDASDCRAGLALSGSTLFGTTTAGGDGWGTVFRMNSDGTGFTIVWSFSGGLDGGRPYSVLPVSGTVLYVTSPQGGFGWTNGTVFRVNTDGSNPVALHDFTGGSDGSNPVARLVPSGTALYGVTPQGGAGGHGTVFRINTDGTGFSTVYTFFGGSDGAWPVGLVLSAGTLYGVAEQGGNVGRGTIYKVSTNGTGFTTLWSFTGGSDGAYPYARPLLSGSVLYGTTSSGGDAGKGTVFALSLPSPPPQAPLPLLWQTTRLSGVGEVLVLGWTNSAFSLQVAPAIGGPYIDVPGATSPYAVSTAGPQMFFRLQAN
jgi:uncharacterized repeat protein (TIGR03803 family)